VENVILDKFKAGEPCLGTFAHLLSAASLRVLGQTGLDYVILDLEHSPIGPEHVTELIPAARQAGLCPLVRVNAMERGQILKMLDAGAAGLIVPQVETAEQVRRLVSYAKFAPLGNRGYCPTVDGGWGFGPEYENGMAGYMKTANGRTLLIPQCETAECLAHVEEIAAIDGVDGMFIGPFDLSIALGIPGQFDHPDHIAAVERVRKACADAGKLCIMFCGDGDAAAGYFRQGFPNVTVGIDVLTLLSGMKTTVETAKRGL
jgi:2-keto-3-deoxy-L-rhamnonate aldolase RhmA